jgi:ABC-type glycerol-3-phosphate transport system substrate-binding protein
MAPQKSLSRRDFLKLSSVALGAAAAARGFSLSSLALAQDTTQISILFAGRTLEVQYITVIADAFNAKMQADGKPYRATLNPGPASDNDYVTKVNLDAASGTLSDIVEPTSSQFADMVAAGYLADLTPMLANYADWDKFAPVIKDQLTVNGGVYALADASTFTLFFRKDLLEESGISTDQPATWDDFFALCDEIATKTQATPAGIPAATPWGGGTWGEGFRHVWLGFAQSNEIWDPADEKWVVKSDGLLKAFQVYETLATKKWLTVQDLLSPDPWQPIKYQGFPNKTVAVVTGGDWQWEFDWGPKGATPIDGVLEKVGRWLFPSSVSEPFPTVALGRLSCIFSQSPNADAAFEFITWAYSPEGSCAALETYFGGPSARSDYADNCPYYGTAIGGKMLEAGNTLETGRYLKTGVGESKISDGIARATEDVITLAKTAEQAMNDFAASMADLIGADGVKEL